ncbi:hypothetical protein EON82_05690 [bacterium]|nr:MAG: hypothetical protein EON82_05690 [bacterium]
MTAFVTFRFDDSLPAKVVDAYRSECRRLDRLAAREPNNIEVQRERTRLFCERIDRHLDAGHGSCALGNVPLAELVLNALRFFDGERCVFHAAVVMPNHAHVVATLAPEHELAEITHSWKSFTAHQAVERHGQAKPFWQSESYDHIVRDGYEFDRMVRYVLDNPRKAGLTNWPHVFGRRD